MHIAIAIFRAVNDAEITFAHFLKQCCLSDFLQISFALPLGDLQSIAIINL